MGRSQLKFEGFDVSEIEVEITGGGTHETGEEVHAGDEGTAVIHWRCVAIKHPFRGEEVRRIQTLNVIDVKNVKVTESYTPVPKAEQPELTSV